MKKVVRLLRLSVKRLVRRRQRVSGGPRVAQIRALLGQLPKQLAAPFASLEAPDLRWIWFAMGLREALDEQSLLLRLVAHVWDNLTIGDKYDLAGSAATIAAAILAGGPPWLIALTAAAGGFTILKVLHEVFERAPFLLDAPYSRPSVRGRTASLRLVSA